ncbi:Hpt domain-containing protein [Chitinophaga qingshengii]|uniref:Hpt domain-containing protein n=1 Tax=Chitinophaga qingshengii TaxID=1569794 RepID=A0ABR7TR05_9BACT|nr:Hpt domain-containing protein [Chitinophaga qingshengii]MBC9932911.1 Hpt domain-containing protein [Chitinophaga qingshengii]
MDQDFVFEFSERFDNLFLQSVYENDILYAQQMFEEVYMMLTSFLARTQLSFEELNWEECAHRLHQLKGHLGYIGQTKLRECVEQLRKQLLEDTVNASAVIIIYLQIQLSLLSLMPSIHAEINRMELYLDTHSPHVIWNF